MQEDEIGGVAADVGRARRRHRYMGGGKRRRVVQPVADHQHLAAVAARSASRPTFSPGSKPPAASAMPSLRGDIRDGSGRSPDRIVDRNASPAQRLRRLRRRRGAGCPRRQNAASTRSVAGKHVPAGCSAALAAPSRPGRGDRARRQPSPRRRGRDIPSRSMSPSVAAIGAEAPRSPATADGSIARPWRRRSPDASGSRSVDRPAAAGRASACRSCRRRPCRSRPAARWPEPSLTMMPFSNRRRAATTCTIGTARPSAQGQVMISTAIAM